ncbi:MAG: hypothetical protein JKX81_14735 [Arenicella sp.]|nr:hypothetical protein [Arenicella sp.]
MIYTTNAIESLNCVIRKAIKKASSSQAMMRQRRWFVWWL